MCMHFSCVVKCILNKQVHLIMVAFCEDCSPAPSISSDPLRLKVLIDSRRMYATLTAFTLAVVNSGCIHAHSIISLLHYGRKVRRCERFAFWPAILFFTLSKKAAIDSKQRKFECQKVFLFTESREKLRVL